jgi:hypothetical protein
MPLSKKSKRSLSVARSFASRYFGNDGASTDSLSDGAKAAFDAKRDAAIRETAIRMLFDPRELRRIDVWRILQNEPVLDRAEAIRRLVKKGLK